jgi:hypothetical protein
MSYAGYAKTKGGRYSLAADGFTAIDVNLSNPSWGGFKDFQEIMADINRIKFSQDSDKYAVTIGGVTKSAAVDNAMEPAEAKALLRELQLSAVGKKTKTGKFTIARSPIAMENQNLAAMVVIPPQEFLTKYIKKADGTTDWAKIKLIKQNGISFIAPKNQWTNSFYLENEPTPTEQIINAKGSITYTHGNKAGEYIIEKVKNVPGVDYAISFSGNWINDDGTVTIKKDYMPFQKSGNMIDASQDEIFNTIQTINEHNMQQFRKFQSTGNQKALANVKTYYKKPEWSGFKY